MAYHSTTDGKKTCPRCERTLPRTEEYWHRNRPQSDGLHNYCKDCRCALSRARNARLRGDTPNPPRRTRTFDFRSWYRDVRMELLIAYSQNPPCCACCGEARYEFLSIDHTKGDGHIRRSGDGRKAQQEWRRLRRAGYPDKESYQVLCHNCNHALGSYGFCPHRPDVTRPVAQRGRRLVRRTGAQDVPASAVPGVVEKLVS